MNTFKFILKILNAFEHNMDTEKPSWECVGAEQLGISVTRWKYLMEILIEEGYITGIEVVSKDEGTQLCFVRPMITLKGLEYLVENRGYLGY